MGNGCFLKLISEPLFFKQFFLIITVLGGAVRNGVLCSRGAIILFVDADGATRFSDFDTVETNLIRLTAFDGSVPDHKTDIDWTYPAISVGSRYSLGRLYN